MNKNFDSKATFTRLARFAFTPTFVKASVESTSQDDGSSSKTVHFGMIRVSRTGLAPQQVPLSKGLKKSGGWTETLMCGKGSVGVVMSG